MPDFIGPAVLRLWCERGHPIGSLIDIVTDDGLATLVPCGASPETWPPVDRVTGRRALSSGHRCKACAAVYVDAVDVLLGVLHAVRDDRGRSTGDHVLPHAPPAPLVPELHPAQRGLRPDSRVRPRPYVIAAR
jgi:hypothetical protein